MQSAKIENSARKAWMSMLACAPQNRTVDLLDALGSRPEFTWLRPPEIGSVMIRGRAGGTGSLFNLGEMTVTRCALQLNEGIIGHGYVQGRSKADAEAAALVDALMQTDQAERVQNKVLDLLRQEAATRKTSRAEKAAATKVDFFTMVRGEDE